MIFTDQLRREINFVANDRGLRVTSHDEDGTFHDAKASINELEFNHLEICFENHGRVPLPNDIDLDKVLSVLIVVDEWRTEFEALIKPYTDIYNTSIFAFTQDYKQTLNIGIEFEKAYKNRFDKQTILDIKRHFLTLHKINYQRAIDPYLSIYMAKVSRILWEFMTPRMSQ